jgi:osmoprotectant transport system ATP-binding protein
MTAVELRAATVRAGDRALIEDVSLSVEAGETLVLLGRSGSGKTTTLKLVNRLLDPSSGEVVVEGKPTSAWDPIELRRRIGWVIQEVGLFPHWTVEENVSTVPRLLGWSPEKQRARARELLSSVGLEPETFARRSPRELSGGQRQRVGVARALAADPPIVLMDEPFGALDPLTRADLQRELGSLCRELGKTVILVTHDLPEAFLLATRIGLFESGRLVELATPAAFRRSTVPEARRFLAAAAAPDEASDRGSAP